MFGKEQPRGPEQDADPLEMQTVLQKAAAAQSEARSAWSEKVCPGQRSWTKLGARAPHFGTSFHGFDVTLAP